MVAIAVSTVVCMVRTKRAISIDRGHAVGPTEPTIANDALLEMFITGRITADITIVYVVRTMMTTIYCSPAVGAIALTKVDETMRIDSRFTDVEL
jgi:hypothetical protein